MELRNIRYFLMLAKVQHVSQTADLLDISQPSLSKAIAALEKDVGIKLFDRKGNHIYLNDNGRKFYEYASQSINLLDTGVMTARNGRYDTAGTITIENWVFSPIIANCISEYLKINPLVTFNLTHDPQQQGIEPDLLVRSFSDSKTLEIDLDGAAWVAEPLFRESYVLVTHPDYIELPPESEPLDISLLRDARFVVTFENSLIFHDITYSICGDAGFHPHNITRVEDYISKMTLISSGSAVTFIPESCLPQARLLCPNLKVYHIKGDPRTRTISLLHKKGTLMSEAVEDFWDFTLDYYKNKVYASDPWEEP